MMSDVINQIICGDCCKIVPKLPPATMVFLDPPDNLGVKYGSFRDKWSSHKDYIHDIERMISTAVANADIVWISIYHRHLYDLWWFVRLLNVDSRLFLWRFTFGQHRHTDCANGYRPILRLVKDKPQLYPDAIRVPSKRQLAGDKRADPRGRVPDDVWEFPRVCGNYSERRRWHPNQHPEALIERIVRFSCRPGDLVIDMCAGTGTVNRVCKRLGVGCIGVEIDPTYCHNIVADMAPAQSRKPSKVTSGDVRSKGSADGV